jgi:hypothetical protein
LNKQGDGGQQGAKGNAGRDGSEVLCLGFLFHCNYMQSAAFPLKHEDSRTSPKLICGNRRPNIFYQKVFIFLQMSSSLDGYNILLVLSLMNPIKQRSGNMLMHHKIV